MNRRSLSSLTLAAALLAGCTVSPPQPDFHSPVPAEKIAAIRQAARTGDTAAIRDLVTQLASADPVVRLMAIRALDDLTGQTHGYRYDDPPAERRAAIDRWVRAVNSAEATSGTVMSNQTGPETEQSANSPAEPEN